MCWSKDMEHSSSKTRIEAVEMKFKNMLKSFLFDGFNDFSLRLNGWCTAEEEFSPLWYISLCYAGDLRNSCG